MINVNTDFYNDFIVSLIQLSVWYNFSWGVSIYFPSVFYFGQNENVINFNEANAINMDNASNYANAGSYLAVITALVIIGVICFWYFPPLDFGAIDFNDGINPLEVDIIDLNDEVNLVESSVYYTNVDGIEYCGTVEIEVVDESEFDIVSVSDSDE